MTNRLAAIVIPARYASSRFPGKPLARRTGKFLIQHVVEQAQKVPAAARVVVATDDARIFDAVRSFGGAAVMTSAAHASGTDRIAEVIRQPEFQGAPIVVNIQGDEPEIEPEIVEALIESLQKYPEAQLATAATRFEKLADVANPNMVKVVTDHAGFALYFSRSVIPFDRDGASAHTSPAKILGRYHKHLGIYAYRRDALLTLAQSPLCELEQLEKLEQLRALYLGMKIHVIPAENAPHGIDTPEDYAAFVERYNHANPELAADRHRQTQTDEPVDHL